MVNQFDRINDHFHRLQLHWLMTPCELVGRRPADLLGRNGWWRLHYEALEFFKQGHKRLAVDYWFCFRRSRVALPVVSIGRIAETYYCVVFFRRFHVELREACRPSDDQ